MMEPNRNIDLASRHLPRLMLMIAAADMQGSLTTAAEEE